MKLTPLAKAFVALVILGVIGYTGYHYYGDQLKEWSKGGGKGGTSGGGGIAVDEVGEQVRGETERVCELADELVKLGKELTLRPLAAAGRQD